MMDRISSRHREIQDRCPEINPDKMIFNNDPTTSSADLGSVPPAPTVNYVDSDQLTPLTPEQLTRRESPEEARASERLREAQELLFRGQPVEWCKKEPG